MTKVILIILSLFCAVAAAQPKAFFRSDGQFVANGNEYPRGFWVPAIQNADEVFKDNPEALALYQDHVRLSRWFGILNWGAVGAFATYALVSSANDNYESGVGLVIFLVPWVSGLVVGSKAGQKFIRAMNLINGVPANEARWKPKFGESSLSLSKATSPSAGFGTSPILAWSF